MLNSTFGLKGYYRLRLINKYTGKCRVDTDWFSNTILDSGRDNAMAVVSNWITHAHVGTNGDNPSVLDTGLKGLVATTSTKIGTTTTGNSSEEPYYGWKRTSWRFAAGTVTAVLAEVGVGWGSAVDNLISRAKIIDPISGDPTTITPLADEILDLSYELRYYPPTEDTLNTVELAGVTYNTITRAANVTGSRWSINIGDRFSAYASNAQRWIAYGGNIGTMLTGPSGVATNSDNYAVSTSAYADNSYSIKVSTAIGPTGFNVIGGIRSILFRTTMGEYQTQFNAVGTGDPIPKTTILTMQLAWNIGWDNLE